MHQIHAAFAQHRGLARRTQQDALLIAGQVEQADEALRTELVLRAAEGLCAVADGVAASPYPDLASRTVLEALREAAQARPDLCQEGWIGPRMVRRFVHDALCRRLSGDPRRRESATTLALLQWHAERYSVLNVGDSRVYRIDPAGCWKRLSKDHTYFTSMVERGELDPDQSVDGLYHDLEHMLSADASEDGFAVHWVQGEWAPGEMLLLCTDGMHATLGDERLQALLDPAAALDAQIAGLRQAVLTAGAPDNFSLIVLRRPAAPRHRLSAAGG